MTSPAVALTTLPTLTLPGALVVARTNSNPTRQIGCRWKRLHLETDLCYQRPSNPLFDAGHAHPCLQRFLKGLHVQLDLGLQPRNLALAVIQLIQHLAQQEALVR